jgi:archaellum component FlaC
MSRTEEISTDVKAVGASADEARGRAEETLEYAREQIEMAFEHGWDGVAQSITIAGEALEKINEELANVQNTFENATRTLDAISEQMSSTEVAEQLALTLTELEATDQAFQGTVELVGEAVTGAEQADHQALAGRLHTLREDVERLSERLLQSRTDTESEQEQAEKMGKAEDAAKDPKGRDDSSDRRDDDKDDAPGN